VRTDENAEQLEYKDYNNTGTSSMTYDVDVVQKTLNDPYTATFPAGMSDSRLCKINASEHIGYDLCIEVTATGPNARIEMLTQADRVPDLFDHNARDTTMDGEMGRVQFPVVGTGIYYLLVTVDDPGAEPDNVTITARVKDFSIREVRPEKAGNNGPSTLIIIGAVFKKGDTVSLRHMDGDPIIEAQSVIFRNSGCLTASFLFQSDKLGKYDVIVARTTESVVLVKGFELIFAEPLEGTPEPTIQIIIFDFIRDRPLVRIPF
jgi:hypothetical protein